MQKNLGELAVKRTLVMQVWLSLILGTSLGSSESFMV